VLLLIQNQKVMTYSAKDLLHGARVISRSVFGRSSEYHLQFNHEEDGKWYVDFPGWPFDHHNLMMVAGADKLCAFLSDDDEFAHVTASSRATSRWTSRDMLA
jgi:hypothetical protein